MEFPWNSSSRFQNSATLLTRTSVNLFFNQTKMEICGGGMEICFLEIWFHSLAKNSIFMLYFSVFVNLSEGDRLLECDRAMSGCVLMLMIEKLNTVWSEVCCCCSIFYAISRKETTVN